MEKVVFLWVVGDPSNDGHGKCVKVPLEIMTDNKNEALNYIKNDFEKECKDALKLDIASWFEDYEDNDLSEEDFVTLEELGYKFDKNFDIGWVMWQDFLDIWLFLLNHLRPDLNAKKSYIEEIEPSGGYGLFE